MTEVLRSRALPLVPPLQLEASEITAMRHVTDTKNVQLCTFPSYLCSLFLLLLIADSCLSLQQEVRSGDESAA